MMLRVFALCTTLALAACRETVAPTFSNGTLAVTVQGTGLVIANRGSEKIYYLAVNENARSLGVWTPCVDPIACPGVEANGTRFVPWSDVIGGGSANDEIQVNNWQLGRQPDGTYVAALLEPIMVRH